MDVSLPVLRYFCVLADELHFGNAARALNISAPSLSQQITRLERTLGVVLFDRNPRKVVLTAAGAELLPLARRVRDDHDEVLHWARSRQRAAEGGLLRVGMVAAGAGDLTTAILMAAIQRMPTVRIEMRRLGFFDVREHLLSGSVDVAFGPGPILTDDRMRVVELWTEPRVLVVPAHHRLAGRTSISILEASDEVFLAPSGGSPDILDWWLVDPRPDGSHPRRGPSADDIDGLLELTAAGVGVNIAGASAASHYGRAAVAFVPIDDIAPATILLCSLLRPTNPSVHEFEAIADELAAGTTF